MVLLIYFTGTVKGNIISFNLHEIKFPSFFYYLKQGFRFVILTEQVIKDVLDLGVPDLGVRCPSWYYPRSWTYHLHSSINKKCLYKINTKLNPFFFVYFTFYFLRKLKLFIFLRTKFYSLDNRAKTWKIRILDHY